MKQMIKRRIKRIIAITLASVMLFGECVIGYAAKAETESTVSDDMIMAEDMEEDLLQAPTVVPEEKQEVMFEMEELRDQNTKQFRRSDGTVLAAQYGMDVHYENEEGTWEEIDNRFLYEEAETREDFTGYSTAEGAVEYKFAPQSGVGEIIRLTEGDYAVGFELMLSQQESQKTEQPMETEEAKVMVLPENYVPLEVAEISEETGILVNPKEATEVMETPVVTEVPVITRSPVVKEEDENTVIEKSPLVFLKGEVLNAEELPKTMELVTTEDGFLKVEETEAETDITETVEEIGLNENEILNLSSNEDDVEEAPVVWADVESSVPEENADLLENMKVEKAVTSVGYGNVLQGVSLQYIVFGSSLKEYILVNQKQDNYCYDFRLNLENLIPEQQEDGKIYLKDKNTGEAIYEIPEGYMTDGAGDYSKDVHMSLRKESDSEDSGWILRVAADADWINAEERVLPVQIDPTLNSLLYSSEDVRASYVVEAQPENQFLNTLLLLIGYEPGEGQMKTYVQLKNLPSVPKDSVICGASCFFDIVKFSPAGATGYIQAYKVQSETTWNQKITWEKQPVINPAVMDYVKLTTSGGTYVPWDITELIKEHYKKGNSASQVSAFAMVARDSEIMDGYNRAKASLSLCLHSTYPVLQISYRDTKGIEGYYTYQTHLMGNAGTAYVSDYTGKLTVVNPVANYDSTIQSYGLSLVYNSNYNNRYFTNDGDNIHSGNFTNMKLGAGWKLSAQETITEVNLTDATSSGGTATWLVYNDSDGTEHYFKAKSGSTTEFEDEDGLNLTIIKGSGVYTMKDQKDNVKTFQNGYLTKITDANGNMIHIVYNGLHAGNNATSATGTNRITAVYNQPKDQTAKKIFALNYNSSGFLTEIQEVYGKTYQLGYVTYGSNQYLKQISIYNGNTSTVCAKYGYEDTNRHMTHVVDVETDRGIYYIYNKSATGYRIGYFHEYAQSQGAYIGRKVSVTSDEMQSTSYRDYGADNNYETADDVITTYLFNSCGQTINGNSTDYKDHILGVSAQVYTENSGTSKQNNRISSNIAGGQAGVNLLNNSSFEKTSADSEGRPQASGWNLSGTGTSACRDTNPHSGNIHYNLYNANNGQSKMIYQTLTLAPGTYTASAYVNTEGMTSVATNGGVFIKILNENNSQIKASETISHWTDSGIGDGWQRLSVTFTVQTQGTYKVCIQWNYNVGTVRIDDVQLEEAEAPSSFNLVSNGSFENGTTDWTISRLAPTSTQENEEGKKYIHGTGVFSTQGVPGFSYSAKQTIKINKSSNTTFLLSGWSKADSVPGIEKDGENDTKKYWGLTLKLFYTDGSDETHSLPFAAYSNQWQYASMAVVPQKANVTISHAELTCCYYRNVNTARFDSILLTEEPCQTYKYDSDGNLETIKSTGNKDESYDYDSAQNLISMGTKGNGTYTYEYENEVNSHLPTKVINGNVSMEVTYDKFGETTQTTLRNTENSKYMESHASYSNGLMMTQTDQTGMVTRYGYNSQRQQVKVTDAEGHFIETHMDDTWNRVNQTVQKKVVSDVISEVATVDYGYTMGQLTSIARGGYIPGNSAKQNQTYSFTYDKFGNRLSASVGSILLASYEYFNNNGNLQKMTYGENGPSVTYTYDKLDRVKTVNYSDTNTNYGYQYSSEGALAGITVNGAQKYRYTYDSLGRLIYSAKLSGNKPALYTYHKYDTSDRIQSQNWQIGADGFYEYYAYNSGDGTLASMKIGANYLGNASDETMAFSYNGLKQLKKRTSPNLQLDYTYRTISGDRVSSQVEALKYTLKNSSGTKTKEKSLHYTYDKMGNIKKVSNGSQTTTYTYDSQNQLTASVSGSDSSGFTYDTYGNIRTKTNSYGTNGAMESYQFTYGNSQWRDQLTQVSFTNTSGVTKTETLSYDSIGNPTKYFNGQKIWNFEWQHGRQLKTASGGGTTIENTYDMDGVRETKKVGNVTHTYTTLDGKIVREAYSGKTIDYFYDNEGRPYKLIVDDGISSNPYVGHYILNIQGDVIGIMDVNGVEAVTYEYDAWGKEISHSIGGSYGSVLYTYNALKYRGYYQDVETGFYYLNSRYYDSEIGRFINADGMLLQNMSQIIGYNIYAYCYNNPICYRDDEGQRPVESTSLADETNIGRRISLDYMNNSVGIKTASKKPNFTPNPNKRHGSENRQPSGDRERNVGHPNGEEHSRVPKGNRGVRRIEAVTGITITTMAVIVIIADDATLIGVANDVALIPTIDSWWDYAVMMMEIK